MLTQRFAFLFFFFALAFALPHEKASGTVSSPPAASATTECTDMMQALGKNGGILYMRTLNAQPDVVHCS